MTTGKIATLPANCWSEDFIVIPNEGSLRRSCIKGVRLGNFIEERVAEVSGYRAQAVPWRVFIDFSAAQNHHNSISVNFESKEERDAFYFRLMLELGNFHAQSTATAQARPNQPETPSNPTD